MNTNLANEWCDEFRKQFDELKLKPPKNSMQNLERELLVNYIQNLLTTHSARLVERIINSLAWKSLESCREQLDEDGIMVRVSRQALDEVMNTVQAIDIIKDNK